MPAQSTPPRTDAGHEPAESARLDNFVDGAFAFVITLLVIGGTELPRTVAALEDALRGIPAFAACFLQLALFWHGHVRWRDSVRLIDRASLWLSLLLVFFVLIFVFPLHLVYAGLFAQMTGGALSPGFRTGPVPLDAVAALFVVYGISNACMAGTLALLFRHGIRTAVLEPEDTISARIALLVWSCYAAVGLLSATVAVVLYYATANARLVGAASGYCYLLLLLLGWVKARQRARLQAGLPT